MTRYLAIWLLFLGLAAIIVGLFTTGPASWALVAVGGALVGLVLASR